MNRYNWLTTVELSLGSSVWGIYGLKHGTYINFVNGQMWKLLGSI